MTSNQTILVVGVHDLGFMRNLMEWLPQKHPGQNIILLFQTPSTISEHLSEGGVQVFYLNQWKTRLRGMSDLQCTYILQDKAGYSGKIKMLSALLRFPGKRKLVSTEMVVSRYPRLRNALDLLKGLVLRALIVVLALALYPLVWMAFSVAFGLHTRKLRRSR